MKCYYLFKNTLFTIALTTIFIHDFLLTVNNVRNVQFQHVQHSVCLMQVRLKSQQAHILEAVLPLRLPMENAVL